jgi:hypothetical protein
LHTRPVERICSTSPRVYGEQWKGSTFCGSRSFFLLQPEIILFDYPQELTDLVWLRLSLYFLEINQFRNSWVCKNRVTAA